MIAAAVHLFQSVTCPVCKVQVGQWCRVRGTDRAARETHAARVVAAWRGSRPRAKRWRLEHADAAHGLKVGDIVVGTQLRTNPGEVLVEMYEAGQIQLRCTLQLDDLTEIGDVE